MKVWDEVINTAIIGTEKKALNKSIFPIDLLSVIEKSEQLSGEKEIQFLHMAALLRNYRRAGFLCPDIEVQPIEECAEENQSYCSAAAIGALQAAIDDDNDALLLYWLRKCFDKNTLAKPEYIPILFQKIEKNKALRELVLACCGVRGKWMAQFNKPWSFSQEQSLEAIFDHGRLEERSEALKKWRALAPSEAREALEKAWTQESAATKSELLGVLSTGLNHSDEAFLTSCYKEKSQKVKEVALQLLKQLPDSFLVKEIRDFVQPLVAYKKSSSVLGLLNKESIAINISFEIPEHFKSYGISDLDASKIYSEKEFTLDQLIAMIPVSDWEIYLGLKAVDILALLDKKEETQKFISSFARAANTFKDVEWAKVLYKKYNQLCPAAIPGFEREWQEEIVLSDLQNIKDIQSILTDRTDEWSLSFTLRLIQKTAQEPYSYAKAFYKNIIHHFPVSLIEKIDQVLVTEPHKASYWGNIREEIKKMLSIKQQINQSF
jgi:hypothetical protein